jgi:hypothetical protein
MKIKSAPMAALLGLTGGNPTLVGLTEDGIKLVKKHHAQRLPYGLITDINVQNRLFWATLLITVQNVGAIRVPWLSKTAASEFRKRFTARAKAWNDARLANSLE